MLSAGRIDNNATSIRLPCPSNTVVKHSTGLDIVVIADEIEFFIEKMEETVVLRLQKNASVGKETFIRHVETHRGRRSSETSFFEIFEPQRRDSLTDLIKNRHAVVSVVIGGSQSCTDGLNASVRPNPEASHNKAARTVRALIPMKHGRAFLCLCTVVSRRIGFDGKREGPTFDSRLIGVNLLGFVVHVRS